MNLQYLTEEGKQLYREAIDYGLGAWYDPMNGNFIFDPLTFYDNQSFIIRFLKDHGKYALTYDNDLEVWGLVNINNF